MKTFKNIIGTLAIIGLLATSSFANNGEDKKEFESQVKSQKSSVAVNLKNAYAPVQITLLEEEEGIVSSEYTTLVLFEKQYNYSNLSEGKYTILVEYNGETVKTKSFEVK